MEYLVIKVKEKNLFWNADEMMGEYIFQTPMLLDEEQVDSIMKYCPDKIYHINEEDFTEKHELEVCKVKLVFI